MQTVNTVLSRAALPIRCVWHKHLFHRFERAAEAEYTYRELIAMEHLPAKVIITTVLDVLELVLSASALTALLIHAASLM